MDDLEQKHGMEAPRGMYPSRVDDRGRLKLPVAFQEFFRSLPEKKVFVTSLDRRIAQIYPIATWRKNEAFFETYMDDPDLARMALFTANELGEESEMDNQGRIGLSTDLRRELGLEDQPVKIYASNGSVEIMSEVMYKAQREESLAKMNAEGLNKLRRAGLK